MSYQNPKRPVHIDSYENNGNLLNPSQKYVNYVFGGGSDWESR